VFEAEKIVADDGLFSLIADVGGRILSCNSELALALGVPLGSLTQLTLWDLADRESVQRLLDQARDVAADGGHQTARMQLACPGGQTIRIAALISTNQHLVGTRIIRIVGFDDTENFAHVAKLEYATEMLNGFTDASTEAMWCIEYTEPVDLTAGEQEIVRQVFENECHWSMCNRAMAQIYNLPEGLDFNRQRVASYFRRSPTNEAFVRELIDSSFHIDSAPSVDVRHDGTVAYMENSVRCHIEDGKMLRMWGTVRDTTEFRTAHNRLAQREREVREVLSAIPDAVLVVNKAKQLLAVNPAFESAFGWRARDVLGKDVSAIINLDSRREDDHRWFARAEQRWIADIAQADGTVVACDVRMAPFPDDEFSRFVLCLRPTAASPAELAPSARAHRPRRAKSRAIRR
jgi:PAS domain S-box-containing protein